MKKEKENKKRLLETKKQDFDKYTISGLWITMCGSIVLMFVKELLTNNYLIHLYVDSLVAIVGFYIALHNLYHQYQLIQSYQMTLKPLVLQVIGILIGFVVVIMTLKSPFDYSFLILVVAYLTSKRKFEKELFANK